MILLLILVAYIDALTVQAFSNLNFNAARISHNHATNTRTGSNLSFTSQTKSSFNSLLSFTRLNVTTKQPPEPPGHGKSALDIILLPLLTVALIPAVLLATDVKSIEISIVSKDATNESLIMTGSSIQTADATINPMDFMGSSITSTGMDGNYAYLYDYDSSSTNSQQSFQNEPLEVLKDTNF